MGSIVDFKDRQIRSGRHAEGQAKCLACQHTYIMVAPVGQTQFECPQCHTNKAVFVNPMHVSEGKDFWLCNCGNEFHVLTPEGALCVNCGVLADYDDLR